MPYHRVPRGVQCEARILWELGRPEPHRSIVRVTRFHQASGTAYIVMDYEEGEPLSALLDRQGRLPLTEVESILFPLLDGLERVHAASVLHRDIKPANLDTPGRFPRAY